MTTKKRARLRGEAELAAMVLLFGAQATVGEIIRMRQAAARVEVPRG